MYKRRICTENMGKRKIKNKKKKTHENKKISVTDDSETRSQQKKGSEK